ncbi:hypothetical protein E3N88_26203 [Mikania micrantha]|uniref:Glycine-rich protein n=1 Tax=Mikania micrantha TaxID=192012 RepID=A0A5N6N709_9ASTR|nr:hypothetical protein E3N88_26203 [Mikania micrantha]
MASSSKLFLLLVVVGFIVCTSRTAQKLTGSELSFQDEKTLDGGGLTGRGLDLEEGLQAGGDYGGGSGLGGNVGGGGGFGDDGVSGSVGDEFGGGLH